MGMVLVMAVTLVQQSTSSPTALAPPASRPVGSMSDLMSKVIYPASDAVFYISTRAPKTDAEWG